MEEKTKVDLTRWPRAERRRMGKQMKGKIMGRNLPYVESVHKSISNFNALRERELKSESVI